MLSLRTALAGLVLPLALLSACSDGSGDDDPGAASGATGATGATPSAAGDQTVADTLIAEGLARLETGESAEATRLFTSVLDLDPGNVYAHYNLGYLAQLDGQTAPALEQYTAALATEPGFAPALYNLAILTEPADLQAAVDLYRRALASSPDDAATHFRLGHALVELGEADEGTDLVERSVELDPALADVPAPEYG